MYDESEVNHRLFATYFTNLEVDDEGFEHEAYWNRIGRPTTTNPRESLIREPLMRVIHKLIVGSLLHRTGSKERCQKRDLWLMHALEESKGINLPWVIVEHLFRHGPGLKEGSSICGGHYVTKIAEGLGFLVEDEVEKCSDPIECEKWSEKSLASELDKATGKLLALTELPRQEEGRQEPSGLNSSWGDWNAHLDDIQRENVWRDSMMMRNNYMLEHSMPILHSLADRSQIQYPTYDPPNVPPYPYPYVPYPYSYTHYPPMGNPSFSGGDVGTSGVPSYDYDVGGSSRRNDDDDYNMED